MLPQAAWGCCMHLLPGQLSCAHPALACRRSLHVPWLEPWAWSCCVAPLTAPASTQAAAHAGLCTTAGGQP